MKWLYHALVREEWESVRDQEAILPASLAREGFVHTSYRDDVVESASLYLPAGAAKVVLQIDPRRLFARVDVAETPRGPMPHVHGAIPEDAIARAWELDDLTQAIDANAAPDRVQGTRFAFVAFEGMTLLDLVGVYDPLSRIASMGFDPTSRATIIAAREGEWRDGEATLHVERTRPALDAFDVVIVPGGQAARALREDANVTAWLASFPSNRLMASVCTGALLLGAAGRLRGKRATTHESALDLLAAYGATPVRERVVDEGQVVTSGGVTSALDLGMHLVRRLEGSDVAARIAVQMEYRASG
jgi:putative intracellular protease/amidase/uncharacterized protein (DUF952 family)